MCMEYYTVYKITNSINNKYYIGCHKTKDLDDGYMGSGKLIKRAIEKYGIDNFKKEIIIVLESLEEMFLIEKDLIDLTDPLCYNLTEGGNGGFDYINNNKLSPFVKSKEFARECREKANSVLQEKYGDNWNKIISKIGNERLKNILIKDPDYLKRANTKSFEGKKHSEETKKIMSQKARKRLSNPLNNPQYGKQWITNGIHSRMIFKTEIIPNGWYKGRKINK